MTRALLVVAALFPFTACVPPNGGYMPGPAPATQTGTTTPDPQPAPEPQPEPQPDTRTPAQVTIDILNNSGYSCVVQDNDLACTSANESWQFFVWYENQADGTIQVVFDSFLQRAFAHPCTEFDNALPDLRDDSKGFSATCEDNIQKFRLRQRLVYDQNLDVPGWAADHLQRRLFAAKQLRSIHALSKDDARAISRIERNP